MDMKFINAKELKAETEANYKLKFEEEFDLLFNRLQEEILVASKKGLLHCEINISNLKENCNLFYDVSKDIKRYFQTQGYRCKFASKGGDWGPADYYCYISWE